MSKSHQRYLFPIGGPWSGEGRGYSIFWWAWYPIEVVEGREPTQGFGLDGGASLKVFPLEGYLDLSIRKPPRCVLHLLTVMILKRVSESIFFQSSKFTACYVKHGKEGANTLMLFNLLKTIPPFQGKKHLWTHLVKLKL